MRFFHETPQHDLTYSDVFFMPGYSDIGSRFEVDLTPPDGLGTNLPVVVANMNAVAGKRMAETVARRGGLAILPQDVPYDVLAGMIDYIKSCHPVYETPLVMNTDNTINEALGIIHKRAHQAVIVVDDKDLPVGIFTEADAAGHDLFTQLGRVMSTDLITVSAGQSNKAIFNKLHRERVHVAPVLDGKRMIGVITQKGVLRSDLYKPALDDRGRLMVAVAIGINGDVAGKAEAVLKAGADVLVLDTAHGHQKKMLEAIKRVRAVAAKVPLVAGNVVTKEATGQLIEAGADIVKVGVGPGAMCTTRMMTGVGRPQFSAVLDCAAAARQMGKYVWADGGIRYPRDVALALAAGASCGFIGSWFAGTYESAGDALRDRDGRLYKENYGMASRRAVKNRTADGAAFEQALKELFEEGISSSRLYLHPERPGVEDLIDQIVAGVRSSMSYAGARTIAEFQQKAVIGLQSAAGYQEGRPVETSWF